MRERGVYGYKLVGRYSTGSIHWKDLPGPFKQVMTYLKLPGLKNGILLNFNIE